MRLGTPATLWRTTTTSGSMASRVFAVSRMVSAFVMLEVDGEKFTTSAESRLPAISKLVRVRVEDSKNRLIKVRPRKRRHLLDLAASDLLHVPGRLEDALDLVALQILDAEEIAPLHRPSPSSDSTTTSSGPSRVPSRPRTTTRSRREVGMFFPT